MQRAGTLKVGRDATAGEQLFSTLFYQGN